MEDDHDDIPMLLSTHTLSALHEFLKDQQNAQDQFEKLRSRSEARYSENNDKDGEDWQYDQNTSQTIAEEILINVANNKSEEYFRIACISTPTIFVKLKSLIRKSPNNNLLRAFLFEYDTRFDVYGKDFIHYDYKQPAQFRDAALLKGTFDFVVVDPPFLSEECCTKTMITVRWLAKPEACKIIVCTGEVMSDLVERLIKARMTTFYPQHQGGLANEFRCFVNYQSEVLKWNNDTSDS
ncbi:7020_t:CDS:2 [Ambispora gerdemannii]|uniref:Protein-lysine N-methyltransferase EFM5 n=1 Tax=Ambispora gerdemannii TaxID=144530 RepID=A0A9N8W4Z7_9GLOM|nr:7020_t:CDS:2 [Ambispora gerdemannii]